MAIYRVPIELRNTSWPSSCFNIWHVRMATAGDDPGPAVNALYTWYNALKGYLAPSTTVAFPVAVVNIEDDTEKSLGTVPASIVTASGSAAPPGLAVTFSWKTSIRARRGRGRTFFGPLSQSAYASDGKPSGTLITAATTATNALIADSAGNVNGWALGIYGQQSAGIADPKVLRDITGYTIGAKLAHLRTRRD